MRVGRVMEFGKLEVNRNKKKRENLKKWVVSWISFNIFQEVKLGIRITFDYFWLLHLFV